MLQKDVTNNNSLSQSARVDSKSTNLYCPFRDG